MPGTLNNYVLMDENGATPIFFCNDLVRHPTEKTCLSGCLGYPVLEVGCGSAGGFCWGVMELHSCSMTNIS